MCLLVAAFYTLTGHKSEEAFMSEYLPANEADREALALEYSKSISYQRMLVLLKEKRPQCHIEAHALGRALAQSSHTVPEAIKLCDNTCDDGCLHGVEMRLFSVTNRDLLSGTEALQNMAFRGAHFCSDPAVRAVITASKCMHGLGHAIVSASRYALDASVTACKALPDQTSREVCAGGAFMEYLYQADTAKDIRQDTYYPCDRYSEFSWQCFHYKATLMRNLLGAEGAKNACLKLPTPMDTDCVKGLAFALASDDMLQVPGGLDPICDSYAEPYKEACIDGALAIMPQRVSDWSDADCDGIAPEYKARCLMLFQWLQSYQPQAPQHGGTQYLFK